MNLLLSLTVEVAGNVAKLNVLERQTNKTPEIKEEMERLNLLIAVDRKTIGRLELAQAQKALDDHRKQVYADAMNH